MHLQNQSPQPLISTKLFAPPPRFHLVSRPRLLSRLLQASQYPLTLICAPAGYGKTTLLAEWLAEDPAPSSLDRKRVGWLSLDEEDNDLTRFLAYLLAALEKVYPGIGSDAQDLLRSPQAPPAQTILAGLINDLQNLAQPLWLVLDDYHFITNPAIHTSITFLLEHLPTSFHLVIATRSDPPLPLHRLRACNHLLEMRTDDLRFTTEESAAFVNQVMDLSLTAEDVLTLESRTEGWIAGLQMAALSMQGMQDRATFVRDFGGSHRYILEYLIEEILNRQPGNIQTFLLQTSVLDRLCPTLCDAVLLEPCDSRGSLDYLERSNLFVTSLDDVRCWYRYHHLFADLLRVRLVQSHPELLPTLHKNACLWYEHEGQPEEAIKHALAAHALGKAADLVERYAAEIMHRGEMSTLLNLIQALPEDLMNLRPYLCISHAWALAFSGQFGQVEARLKQAESQVQPSETHPYIREILGNVASIRGLVADFSGDMTTAVHQARMADELISNESYLNRAVILFVLGDGYYAAGDLEQADQTFEKILHIGQGIGNLWTSEIALFKLSMVKRLRGKLRAAWDMYQEAVQLAAQKRSLRYGFMGTIYICMSEIQREWNELATAQQTASQAISVLEHWPNPLDFVSAHISLARIAIAQGDPSAAEQALLKVEDFRRGKSISSQEKHLDDCKVRIWLAKGDLNALLQWVKDRKPDDTDPIPDGKQEPVANRERLTLARALMALEPEGVDSAVHLLTRLAEGYRAAGQAGMLIETLALLARAHRTRGETYAALKTVRECLALTQGEGYLRVFLDEGEPMRGLLVDLQSQMLNTSNDEDLALIPELSRILSAFPPVQQPPAQPVEYDPSTLSLVEPLSARELEVLALICQGASNQEIAEKLVVSLNTVKKHNNRIFGKLGVTSRIQAVLLARRFGLFAEAGSTPED